MEILSLLAVVTAFLLVALYFDKMPVEIPNHFNIKGEPDGYSQKKIFWSLPVFGLMMYLFLSMVGLFVTRVTRPEERKPEAMQQVSFMIAQLKMILVIVALYLVISTIRIAFHHAEGLSVLFLPGIFGVDGPGDYLKYEQSHQASKQKISCLSEWVLQAERGCFFLSSYNEIKAKAGL